VNTLLKPFYAVVPLSLEELFAKELTKLGIEKFRLEKGGCWFGAEMSQMMQVNLWTRYASRILLKVTEGPYRTEEDIYKLAKSFRWEQYFTPENTFKIELSSRRSPLKSVAFAALRVKDAVCDYFRETTSAPGRRKTRSGHPHLCPFNGQELHYLFRHFR